MAGDMDLDTSGGNVEARRVMGNYVRVSAESRDAPSSTSGAVSVGAVYADTLHLSSGEALCIYAQPVQNLMILIISVLTLKILIHPLIS